MSPRRFSRVCSDPFTHGFDCDCLWIEQMLDQRAPPSLYHELLALYQAKHATEGRRAANLFLLDLLGGKQ